ncbi:MAG: hypothetical protein AAF299_00165 [Pseudomonadota bacterium]
MTSLAKSLVGASVLALLATGGAHAADHENEIGLIVAGVTDSWNGVQFIDGGFTGDDTTLASGHNARLSLPLGDNLSLQTDVDVEWNDRAFDNNEVSGQRWGFQGAGHFSWRDPSRGLFGVFGGVAASSHNDSGPTYRTNLRFVGGEAQVYIDNLTLYAQAAYVDQEGELTGDGFFARGVGRWFTDSDTRFQVEGLFANLDFFDGQTGDYDIFQWGARFDTVWNDAPIVGSLPIMIAYRGTLRDGCLGVGPDTDTSDHTIMAGFSYHWGATSKLDSDRRGATLDTPNVATLAPCYDDD